MDESVVAGCAWTQLRGNSNLNHVHFKKKIDSTAFHGTYLENPRTVNQFSLIGTDQKPFENKSLQGHWTLVFFGFTNCGYLCPTTMAELGKMYRLLEEKGVKIIVSKENMNFLKGAKLDYVDSLQGGGFKISNSNAKDSCGCGQSFEY